MKQLIPTLSYSCYHSEHSTVLDIHYGYNHTIAKILDFKKKFNNLTGRKYSGKTTSLRINNLIIYYVC